MGTCIKCGGIRGWAVLLLAVPYLAAQAQDALPDRRSGKPPVVSGSAGSGSTAETAMRQSMLDLQQQFDQLQTEQRQLRDTVEVQAHEMEQLKTRQRDLLSDIDRRMRDLERRGTGEAGMGAVPEAGAVPPSPGSAVSLPAVVPAAAGSGQVNVPPNATQQQEYEAAFDLMKQGNYERAIKSFRTFIAKHPDSTLADNAQYWVAEANYVLRNYKLALEEFSKVLAQYPRSTKAPDSLLKIGYVHYETAAYDKARTTLNDVMARYPNTTAARLAVTRLEKMKKEGK
jgi:tol-pal system protein YbgF